jgi:tetratricopeptide (TPR) repeat protein
MAEVYYEKAMQAETQSAIMDPEAYHRIYHFYAGQDRWKEALQALQSGVESLPTDPELRLSLARTYERQGVIYRAVEEYRKALILSPNNQSARSALERLTGKN